jgi:hypothetical protein
MLCLELKNIQCANDLIFEILRVIYGELEEE